MPRIRRPFLSERLAEQESSTMLATESLSMAAGTSSRAEPTSASTRRQISYFDEGTGFSYVKEVGKGLAATASLVKSTHNDKLYVRKEEKLATVTNFEDAGPCEEIEIASRLKHLPGIAQLKGWVKYEKPTVLTTKGAFYVSYWDYYNFGTPWDLCQREQYQQEICIPDHWIFSWLVSMLRTVIALHQNGVVHHDAHAHNWFLNWNQSTDVPTIVLGDFGLAKIIAGSGPDGPCDRQGVPVRPWSDYSKIVKVVSRFSQPLRPGTQSSTRKRINEWVKEIKEFAELLNGPQLEEKMMSIADEIEQDARSLPDPVPAVDMTGLERPVVATDLPVLQHLEKPAFKQWKIVETEGDAIIPESLQTQNMGDPSVSYVREGDWDEELIPKQSYSLAFN